MPGGGWLWSWLLGLALLVSALLGACQAQKQNRFPHVVHLTELDCGSPGAPQCLSCASCHSPAQKGRAHKLPDASLCEQCHKDDAHSVRQVLNMVPPRPDGEIGFNHDKHLSMGPIAGQCVPCHAGVVKIGKPTIPPMSQCFTCHEHQEQFDKGECAPCHLRRDLKHILPRSFMQHDASFMRHHGSEAVQQEQLCQACHAESDCQSCHDMSVGLAVETRRPEQIESRQVHRGDFMVRHAIEARSQPGECQSCHEPQDCDSCHVARGVSGNALGSNNPHPPGWVGGNPASRDFHGRAARRDLLACASCHEQGPLTNCIRCHQVGGSGGNPHPRGWSSLRETGSTMCRYCHGGL